MVKDYKDVEDFDQPLNQTKKPFTKEQSTQQINDFYYIDDMSDSYDEKSYHKRDDLTLHCIPEEGSELTHENFRHSGVRLLPTYGKNHDETQSNDSTCTSIEEGGTTITRTVSQNTKRKIFLAVFLFLVTLSQGFMAWYGAEKTRCKKTTTKSATLAPIFMFGIAVIEIFFSTLVITITFTRKLREKYKVCTNTRLIVKLVTACLIVLLLIYLSLVCFVELFSEEYDGCRYKKILLKAQAIMTVVQGCLFVILIYI
ncbi:uncharacterized protein [Clytia hemisphaerica]|uniref:Uncharacterized protein n=1 Tax=Clytia hemisphaerica TaxID=252671 RepID=A0A7M5V524_9CNID